MLPGFLTPVFRDIHALEIILPPFEIQRDVLIGGNRDSESGLEQSISGGYVVKLKAPITAQEGHALWANQDGKVSYGPNEQIKDLLKAYAIEQLSVARNHFRQGSYAQVLDLAQRAINAADSCRETLILLDAARLKQEVYKQQGDHAQVVEMGHFIESLKL